MPRMNNTPAPTRGRGAVCQLNPDTSAYTTTEARIQHLGARFGISLNRAAILAPFAFGEGAHV